MSGAANRSFRVLVPVVFAIAGLLAATSVATSHGSQLPGQRDDLPGLVVDRQASVTKLDRQATALRKLVDTQAAGSASGNAAVRQARGQEAKAGVQAGLPAASGPGLTVALDDAPRSPRRRPLPPGVPQPTPDDLVVHQQDVQAALNGLRAGGARALSVMGQRVIATTAVKCVGNTLLVNGRVYSPPFVLVAIGDPDRLRAALDAESGVEIYQQYVAAYGLRLTVTSSQGLHLPAYTGAVALVHAKALSG
ncbi:MAG TPA: DUF881 domain-containing protein [Frankiaceae bacterium]|jgi:uncharacterized protein YlxW (UPF0749 family)|nr:DUF881 domain-containing protein [Frankiaceae bacterium]